MSRLVVNPGSPTAWEIQLKPGSNFIGRGFANDFKLADGSVSTSHCQIDVTEQGVVIKDLGSTNGTFVNRAMVREAALHDGQTIHLGGVELVFHADDGSAPKSIQTTPPFAVATPVIPPVPVIAPRAAAANIPIPPPPSVSFPAPPPPSAAVRITLPAAASAKPAAVPAKPAPFPVSLPPPPNPVNLLASSRPAPAISAAPAAVPVAVQPPAAAAQPVPVALPVQAVPAVAVARAAALPAVPVARIPAVPAAAPAAAPATGPHFCKFHPKATARFACGQCQEFYCDVCVASRNVGGQPRKFCRHCGAELSQLQVSLQRPVTRGFFARIPGAFGYPFRGTGLFMVIVVMVIFGLLKFGQIMLEYGTFSGRISIRVLVFGILMEIFAGGYLFTYLQTILHSTAAEDPEPPMPPFANFFEEIFVPFFKLLAVALFCFGPAIGLGVWVLLTHQPEFSAGYLAFWAANIFGYVYFPMAFLSMAILDSIIAANPLVVVPSILKAPLEYVVVLALLGAAYGVNALGNFLIDKFFPEGMTTHSMGQLFVMLGSMAFQAFLSLYLLLVAVHLLGLLYVVKRDKLSWLGH